MASAVCLDFGQRPQAEPHEPPARGRRRRPARRPSRATSTASSRCSVVRRRRRAAGATIELAAVGAGRPRARGTPGRRCWSASVAKQPRLDRPPAVPWAVDRRRELRLARSRRTRASSPSTTVCRRRSRTSAYDARRQLGRRSPATVGGRRAARWRVAAAVELWCRPGRRGTSAATSRWPRRRPPRPTSATRADGERGAGRAATAAGPHLPRARGARSPTRRTVWISGGPSASSFLRR